MGMSSGELFHDELLGGPGFDYGSLTMEELLAGVRAGDAGAVRELKRRGVEYRP